MVKDKSIWKKCSVQPVIDHVLGYVPLKFSGRPSKVIIKSRS